MTTTFVILRHTLRHLKKVQVAIFLPASGPGIAAAISWGSPTTTFGEQAKLMVPASAVALGGNLAWAAAAGAGFNSRKSKYAEPLLRFKATLGF